MSYVIQSCCSIKVQNQLLKIVLDAFMNMKCSQARNGSQDLGGKVSKSIKRGKVNPEVSYFRGVPYSLKIYFCGKLTTVPSLTQKSVYSHINYNRTYCIFIYSVT